LLTIARVTGVHGLKGFVKVQSFAESNETFRAGIELQVDTSDGKRQGYTIEKVSSHKKGLLILFKGVDRDHGETLVGSSLLIPRSAVPQPGRNTYFWQDLMGLEVTDVNKGRIGVIHHIFATGSNDVFVVTDSEKETLVPALASVVLKVDIDNHKMLVDLPDGLQPAGS